MYIYAMEILVKDENGMQWREKKQHAEFVIQANSFTPSSSHWRSIGIRDSCLGFSMSGCPNHSKILTKRDHPSCLLLNGLIQKATRQSEEHVTHWRSGLIPQFMSPSDGVKHPEYPVYPSTTDAGEDTVVCLLWPLWLVSNQGLTSSPKLISRDEPIRWWASDTCVHPGGSKSASTRH